MDIKIILLVISVGLTIWALLLAADAWMTRRQMRQRHRARMDAAKGDFTDMRDFDARR